MENKRSSIPWLKAYELYTGRSFLNNTLKLTLFSIALYMFFILFTAFISGIEGEGFKNGIDSTANLFIVNVYGSLFVLMRLWSNGAKEDPGGKFFRTVKGGFDTYAKAHTAIICEAAVMIILFFAVAALISKAGILPLMYGIKGCVSSAVFVFLARPAASFFKMIENNALRSITMTLVFYLVVSMGTVTLILTDGRLGWVHVAAAAAAVILTVISEKVVLDNFRKKHWDC